MVKINVQKSTNTL